MKKLLGVVLILHSLIAGDAVCAGQTFVLNSSYSPPHCTEDQSGYLDQILKAAFARAGFVAEIQMMPAERCLRDSDSGVSDGEIGRIREISQFYPNLVIVDEPIIESRDFVAFSIRHEFRTEDWDSLKPYHVGIMRGWKIVENHVRGTRSLIRMDTTVSLFRLLKNNRADAIINARIDGLYTARQLGIRKIRVLEPPLASLELYLFMHRKNAGVIPRLETALKEMKSDGSFHKIRSRVLADIVGE